MSIKFGEKYAQFGECLKDDINIRVLVHIKDVDLKKAKPKWFVFSTGSAMENKEEEELG